MAAVDVRVTGRVQGVFFRARTREQASRLGVTGWVRNDPDGSVAAHFEGDEAAVAAIVDWCREGPAGAWVSEVTTRASEPLGATGFAIRH